MDVNFILFLIPSSEFVIQIVQYILSKIIKPKPIPKIDFMDGIDKENTCMVIIPTIIKNKEKQYKKHKCFGMASSFNL